METQIVWKKVDVSDQNFPLFHWGPFKQFVIQIALLCDGKWHCKTGVAPEVNLMEHVTGMPPPGANKAAHSGFET